MEERELSELLTAYTEAILKGGESRELREKLRRLGPEAAALTRLAEDLAATLIPVRPDPAFRTALAARLKGRFRRHELQRWISTHRKELAFGAAVVGSVFSVAGVVAYFVKVHPHRQARKLAA